MADSANVLIAAAQALGYDSLSTRAVKECLLYAADTNGGGGGGGSGSVEQGAVPPSGLPVDPLSPAVYTDLSTGFFYTWNVGTQTWALSSTGGGNSITQGHGDPVNPPTDITLASIYVDLDTGTFWSWRVVDQAWF